MGKNTKQGRGLSWVQDVSKEKVSKVLMEENAKIETGEYKSPKGSRYQAGPSRSGKDRVGIYFFDPTAK